MLNYLDVELREEERLVQQTVRDFVEREAMPLIRPCFEAGRFPSELVPRLAELGLLGSTLPEYGAGLGPVGYGMICQELERADSGLRSFVSVQTSASELAATGMALPCAIGPPATIWCALSSSRWLFTIAWKRSNVAAAPA